MNAIALAYKAAGGTLPSLRKRVWRVLADNQDRTSKQITVQLGETHKSVSSALGTLAKLGQVTFIKEQRTGYHSPVMVFRAVKQADGTMPPPTKGTVKSKPAPAPAPKVEAPSPATVVFAPPPQIDVLGLPLREARRIYDQLKEYFNDDR